jgi:transcriptional regulator with XRE-family HTH domain
MKAIKPLDFPSDPLITGTDVMGANIKAARTQAGMRIVDAALLSGVSLQTMVDIEAGRPGVGIGKLLQVADTVGLSLFAVPAQERNVVRDLLALENGNRK